MDRFDVNIQLKNYELISIRIYKFKQGHLQTYFCYSIPFVNLLIYQTLQWLPRPYFAFFMLLCEDVHPHPGHFILRRTRRCMCSIKQSWWCHEQLCVHSWNKSQKSRWRQSMDAEVIVKFDKLVSLQMGLNNKNMFEGDLV
jgi:hypothetical protein